MRTIHVSDSQPLNNQDNQCNIPIVAEVIVSSHFDDWNAKYKYPNYVEMVHKVDTEFVINLDVEMLSWFKHRHKMQIPFKTVSDLLKICQEFAQDQWNFEVKYWKNIGNNYHKRQNLDFDLMWNKFYAKPKCPYSLRLGWGSGLPGTTINMLFSKGLQQDLRDECGRPAPNFEAPKSRRTVMDSQGNIRYVPGWVKFQLL